VLYRIALPLLDPRFVPSACFSAGGHRRKKTNRLVKNWSLKNYNKILVRKNFVALRYDDHSGKLFNGRHNIRFVVVDTFTFGCCAA
jgi:hypothetical protein